MPVCQNCQQTWSYRETLRKSFTLSMSMTCPHCGAKQYLTPESKKKSGMLSLIVPFIVFIPVFFDVSVLFMAGIYIIVLILLTGMLPFLMKLSSKEEPYW